MTWKKSSKSLNNGTCVEVEMLIGERKKSSKSNGSGGNNCVEAERLENHILVRDSKNPNQPPLKFTPAEWQAFIEGVKLGEFDIK